ncbi:MAG TPA: hypothetical protein VHW00_16710 [Thermoanaerobaculia bacterium]|nr:hypothetical protein [Thermoanaerobaculia bacterium]
MVHRIALLLLLLCLAARAEAGMVRFVEVIDGRTIVIERNGAREQVKLAGVEIVDEVQARALLNWTLTNSWLMLEPHGDAFYAYRSPDALFLNRELVLRGFARATRTDIEPQPNAMVTYLGVVHPTDAPKVKVKKSSGSNARGRTGSGTRPRSSTKPSRSSPASTKTSSGSTPASPSSD